MNEECNCLQEEINAYKMENEEIEKKLLKRRVAMNEMMWSIMDLERNLNRLETEKCSLMKRNEEAFYCSSQMNTSGDQIADKLLKHTTPAYLGTSFDVQKSILRYCCREVFELITFIRELDEIERAEVEMWRK